jgi:hypothetical protein
MFIVCLSKQAGRVGSRPVGLFLLFLFFVADHFPAFVMSTIRAYAMRKAHLAAVAALHQVLGFQRIVRTPAVTSAR